MRVVEAMSTGLLSVSCWRYARTDVACELRNHRLSTHNLYLLRNLYHRGPKHVQICRVETVIDHTPMSADVNVSSGAIGAQETQNIGMAFENMLQRSELEHIATTSGDPVLIEISKWRPMNSSWRLLVKIKADRTKVQCDLMKLSAQILVIASRLRLTQGLVFDMFRSCWDLNNQADTQRLAQREARTGCWITTKDGSEEP